MEVGTEIILQRMKDYPEEFVGEGELYGKWERIMMSYKDVLPKEDVEAMDAGYKQLRIDAFNELVLRTLAGEAPTAKNIAYKAKDRYATGMTDSRGTFGNAIAKQEGQQIMNNPQNAQNAMGLSGWFSGHTSR